MKKTILTSLILISLFFPFVQFVEAHSENDLKAAFIRNQDLWVKIGEKEVQITAGDKVHYPKWSFDGQWLAFQKRKVQTAEIWLLQFETGQLFNVVQTDFPSYTWAPHDNKLAFLDEDILKVIHPEYLMSPDTAENMLDQKYESIYENVGNFSWLPDGSGFLLSTSPMPVPEGWAEIQLLIVPEDPAQDKNKVKHLYTIPSQTEKYFAISTSSFKWSPDGKWISFLGLPTASLSADGNTLFVLSSDGRKFVQVADMLNNEYWFKWAPSRNFLAYIEGTGRMATQNKRLKIKRFLWKGMANQPILLKGLLIGILPGFPIVTSLFLVLRKKSGRRILRKDHYRNWFRLILKRIFNTN